MQTSIATVCLSGDLAEKLEAIAAAGFRQVEIFENDLLTFNGTNADARRMMADLGLKPIAFQPFRDFEGWDEPRRARAFARAERKFDTMAELGCDLLMVCSNVSPEAHGGLDRAADDFRELGERAKARGMRVAFEALAWGRHINDYRDAWEVVRRADHPTVGLVLDSFHICARKTDLRPIRSIPKERIFLVQVADAPWLDMDVMQWSRHFRCFPGQGDLPVDGVHGSGAGDRLRRSAVAGDLQRPVPRRLGAQRRHRRPALADLPARPDARPRACACRPGAVEMLPPQSKCLGVEFIEFAVDEKGAGELGQLFRGMGFALAGTHRSKAVTRWTQGGINLVINAEKDGFAHAYQITHGTSVCAIGLKVDDAAATLDRAEKLLDKPFRQPVGPGELEIPAVRGLGGSLLYFIDPASELARWWDIEFASRAAEAPAAWQRRRRTDGGRSHLAVDAVRGDAVLAAVLQLAAEVEKTKELDIADPGGLVRSQVIQTADGALRIVLNGSQSQRTQSARFLSEFFGSGVQHIAFKTDDLVATVRAAGRQRRQDAADPGELLRRSGGARRPAARAARGAARPQHPLRPRRARRVSAGLHAELRGHVLLRVRRAARLQGLRRGQRSDPARRTGPPRPPSRGAAQVIRLFNQRRQNAMSHAHRACFRASARSTSRRAARRSTA